MAKTLNSITLPEGIQWTDEFSTNPVSQTVQRTLSGNVVVYHGARPTGLPITLSSGSDHGWMTRDTLDDVKALYVQSGLVMTLTLGSNVFNVMFSHQDGKGLTAVPLFPMANPASTDYYKVTMTFITV